MTVSNLLSIWNSISIADVIDVLAITVLIYSMLKLVIKTRSFPLLKGVVAFFIIYSLSSVFKLRTVKFLVEMFLQVGFIALLVIFQPEIRRALEQVGSSDFFNKLSLRRTSDEEKDIDRLRRAIAAICDGVERMSEHRTGALIVMEKFTNLSEVRRTGTVVNADITPELIGTIFYEGSPLHDGAVVIQDGRIDTAGCVLPLSNNLEISKDLGTRHRAALGLSEISDSVCLVVSEETGVISVTKGGFITRNMDRQMLYDTLTDEFITPRLQSYEKGFVSGLLRRKNDEK